MIAPQVLSLHMWTDTSINFYFLTTVNYAAMNTGVQVSVEALFSVLLGIYLGVELLGYRVVLFNILRNPKTFPTALFYVPTRNI